MKITYCKTKHEWEKMVEKIQAYHKRKLNFMPPEPSDPYDKNELAFGGYIAKHKQVVAVIQKDLL